MTTFSTQKQPPSALFTIRLSLDDRAALNRAAAADRRTVSSLTRKIIAEWLRKQEKREETP